MKANITINSKRTAAYTQTWRKSAATLLRFYALISPCIFSLSEDYAMFGITYTLIVLAALNTESGRKYIYQVRDAYNNIFTFDKI